MLFAAAAGFPDDHDDRANHHDTATSSAYSPDEFNDDH
jgi:hypothetical protein